MKIALTASSPIFKGKLADIDSRWSVISQSVDCRTKNERDVSKLKFQYLLIKKNNLNI